MPPRLDNVARVWPGGAGVGIADDHMTLSNPIQCRLAMPRESLMNVQCIWRRKYSLGFRVGFVNQGVPGRIGGRHQIEYRRR
jgi:hypothetical protein